MIISHNFMSQNIVHVYNTQFLCTVISVYCGNSTKQLYQQNIIGCYDTTPSVMFSASIVSIVVCRSSRSATTVVSFKVA